MTMTMPARMTATPGRRRRLGARLGVERKMSDTRVKLAEAP
jgi:hypothetical protein